MAVRHLERDDLPVEEELVIAERSAQTPQLGEGRRHVGAGAADDADPAPVDPDEDPHAVPLELERPATVVGREVVRSGQHRLHPRR